MKGKLLLLTILSVTFFLHAQETIFSENFESDVSEWTFGTTGQENVWEWGVATSHAGSRSAYISQDGGSSATYKKNQESTSWLEVSIDLTAYTTADLQFYWKCNGQGGTVPRDYGEVYINDGINHLISGIRAYHSQSSWTLENIDISSYVGESVLLRFKWENNSSLGDDPPFCIDDVVITGTSETDFATLSYIENNASMDDFIAYTGENVQFNIVVKNVGIVSSSTPIKWTCTGGSPTSDSDENTAILTENETENHFFTPNWIAPSTAGEYILKFYTDHSSDMNTENDTTTVTVTVLELQTLPYIENFDSTINPNLPEGWTKENTNNDGYLWQTSNSYPHSPLNNMLISGNIVRQMDDWLYSPPLHLYSGATYQVRFWTCTSDVADPQDVEIFWGLSPQSSAMINGSIFQETITTNAYTERICYLTPSSSGAFYIGWHGISSANSSLLKIDDISISQVYSHDFAILSYYNDERSMQDFVVTPNAEVSIYAAVRNEGSQTESATISWMAEAGSPISHSESSSILSLGNSERYIFSTNWTAPNTPGNYSFSIYSSVTNDQNTANDQISITISVVDPQTIPFFEDFDDVLAPDLPEGWSIDNANRDYESWALIDDFENSTPNAFLITENPQLAMNDWVFSPPLQLSADIIYDFSFWYGTGGLQQTVTVYLGSEPNSTGMDQGIIFTDTTNEAYYQEGTGSISPTSSGIYYLGIHGSTDCGDMAFSNLYFDDVNVTQQEIHDFTILSNGENNLSMSDQTVLINESVLLNMVVKNLGSYSESCPVKWVAENGTPLSDTDETTIVLAPDETENHSFSPDWTAPSAPGTHNIEFFVDLPDDSNSSNDSQIVQFDVIDIYNTFPLAENFNTGFIYFENEEDNDYNWIMNENLYHSAGYSTWNHYTANNNNILLSKGVFDLTNSTSPYIEFFQIAKTEGSYDKCFIEISTDLGENWQSIPTEYYHGSCSNFDGFFDEDSYNIWGTGDETPDNSWWKQEIFDLSAYSACSQLWLRFRLESNLSINRYGWLIDDVTVKEMSSPEIAYNPLPENSSTMICPCLEELSWTNGLGTSTVDIYFSTSYSAVNNLEANAKVISNQTATNYSLNTNLDSDTMYYWRIVSRNTNGYSEGQIWSFTTRDYETSRMEDFESGNLASMAWETSGDSNWIVQDTYALEGIYSAQSGNINHNESSSLTIDLNLSEAGYISFLLGIDSEENNDLLTFTIDGSEKGSWSGSVSSEYVSYYVTAGLRSFQWNYTKNISNINGADAAWLDCIVFPPFTTSDLEAPENVTLSIQNNDVHLHWDLVPGADEYKIFRSSDPNGVLQYHNTSYINEFIDPNAASQDMYFYQIKAVDNSKK